MFGKKKTAKGFQPKRRTLDEINNEYAQHAGNAGHKGMLLRNTLEMVEKTEAEIAEHHIEMTKLRKEANAVQAQQERDAAKTPKPQTPIPSAPIGPIAHCGTEGAAP